MNNNNQVGRVCFHISLFLVIILNVYCYNRYSQQNNYNNGVPFILFRRAFLKKGYGQDFLSLKEERQRNIMLEQLFSNSNVKKEPLKKGGKTIYQLSDSVLQRQKLNVDYKFAERLRLNQKNDSFPLVNDIIVLRKKYSWVIYVIINNGNALPKYRHLRKMNVELLLGNQTFRNIFKAGREDHIRLLKYIVNELPITNTLTLIDHSTSWKYISLPFQVLPEQPQRKLAICTYISDYNSAKEIKSFLAFNLIQNVDVVIFYCAVNYDFYYNILRKEIDFGYVILYYYPWPLTNAYGKIQRSIQISQINSCFYRHRSFFEYIVFIDVDEYMYSELFPNSLYKGIQFSYKINPSKTDLAVCFFIVIITIG